MRHIELAHSSRHRLGLVGVCGCQNKNYLRHKDVIRIARRRGLVGVWCVFSLFHWDIERVEREMCTSDFHGFSVLANAHVLHVLPPGEILWRVGA